MELTLLIETEESCNFKLLDTTCGDSGYLPESSQGFVKDRFKFKDTIGIVQIVLNKTTGLEVVQDSTFIGHYVSSDWTTFSNNFDGWFTINYIVLPTKEWFDSNQDNLSNYTYVYYSDGTYIYKYYEGESTQATFEEVLEVNTVDTTISRTEEQCVSICYLKKCFINICKQIFDLRGFSKCLTKGNVDSSLIYNRDLIWMTINIISYFTEFGQLSEAQRIIELLEEGCNGICKSYNREPNQSGCGCS